MKNILVVYAHPTYESSRMNRALINEITGLENVTVSDLYYKYHNSNIDIVQEQDLILKNDLILLQFPFYWFSTTPLMKMWIDQVFADGFAYGVDGNKLHGKDFMYCITTGGSRQRYKNEVGFDFPDLLKPFEYTAKFCGMNYKSPFVVTDETDGKRGISDNDLSILIL